MPRTALAALTSRPGGRKQSEVKRYPILTVASEAGFEIAMSNQADFLYLSPGFLIRRLQQLAVALFIQSLSRHGLTPMQYTILRVIEASPGIDQAAVATMSVLDKSTVKDVLTRLESRGLLERRPALNDRRSTAVTVTPAGLQLLKEAEPQVEDSRRRLLEPLTTEEREQLLSSIGKLLRAHDATRGVERRKPWRRLAPPVQ